LQPSNATCDRTASSSCKPFFAKDAAYNQTVHDARNTIAIFSVLLETVTAKFYKRN